MINWAVYDGGMKIWKDGKKILVMQHRDELVDQNKSKFERINPYITTSIVNGTVKNWDGNTIFSMVQTISRERNLRDRPKFDMIVVDESHHAAADTYLKVINDKVVTEWIERAEGRKTVVFCSTIKHAEDLLESFVEHDIDAKLVTGDTPKDERAETLHELAYGDLQVVVNVSVLTEGFDAPAVSCIVLTRPCSQKGTMVQMIGRGLRTIDPEEFPGVVKTDCVVLDFGTSVLTHGSLEDAVNLDDREKGEAPLKECPECESYVPMGVQECPVCGHLFESEKEEKEELSAFTMTEYDLMQMSPFRWIDLFGDGSLRMALGFNGFVGVAHTSKHCVAFGKTKETGMQLRVLSVGGATQVTAAADDFLRAIEDGNAAKKTKRWLDQRVTERQTEHLRIQGIEVNSMDFSWTKYKAACMLSFLWNRAVIEKAVEAYL